MSVANEVAACVGLFTEVRAALAVLDETQQTIREAGANAAILQRLQRVKATLVALRDQRARH